MYPITLPAASKYVVWLPPHGKVSVSDITAVRSASSANSRVLTEAGSPDTFAAVKLPGSVV